MPKVKQKYSKLIPEITVNVQRANTFLMNGLSKPELNQRSDCILINCTRVTLKVTIVNLGKIDI